MYQVETWNVLTVDGGWPTTRLGSEYVRGKYASHRNTVARRLAGVLPGEVASRPTEAPAGKSANHVACFCVRGCPDEPEGWQGVVK